MTLLLILASWTLILAAITALCAAARLGDRNQRSGQADSAARETAEWAPIAAHATARAGAVAESGSLAAAGSLAA